MGLSVQNRRVSALGRSVAVRIIQPTGKARAIIVDIHGGGWTVARAIHNDPLNGALAQAGYAVVSVDYRHAPDHDFQVVIDDCETALAWALSKGEGVLGASPVFLHGDSAGAHLSVAAALRCRTSSPRFDQLKGMVLFYGCFDLSATDSVRAAPEDTLVFYGPGLAPFYERVTGGMSETQRRSPAISPLYADLSDMPPALLFVGTADPLIDDSKLLAEKMNAQGREAELVIVPEAPHSFNRFRTAVADRANSYARSWIDQRLD